MKYRLISIFVVFGLSVILFSCSGTLNSFNGRTVNQADKISLLPGGTYTGIWETKDLAVHYTYSGFHAFIQLSGEIRISNRIINSYPVIDTFSFRVSFVNAEGEVIDTRHINTVFHKRSFTSGQIEFAEKFELPAGTAAIAFSYRGECRDYGSDRREFLGISKTPFQ